MPLGSSLNAIAAFHGCAVHNPAARKWLRELDHQSPTFQPAMTVMPRPRSGRAIRGSISAIAPHLSGSVSSAITFSRHSPLSAARPQVNRVISIGSGSLDGNVSTWPRNRGWSQTSKQSVQRHGDFGGVAVPVGDDVEGDIAAGRTLVFGRLNL
jgi:hypothetical protein